MGHHNGKDDSTEILKGVELLPGTATCIFRCYLNTHKGLEPGQESLCDIEWYQKEQVTTFC